MDKKREKKISKSLSFWLRHKPEDIGIKLTSEGWTDVKELMEKAKHKVLFDFNELQYVVKNNDKQRFELSEDFCFIRASQGHNKKLDVDITFDEVNPPEILYHGTPNNAVEPILKEGLRPMGRKMVHLSKDKETASKVGSRRGKFTILEIEAQRMRADGHKIFISKNGVYLTDEVPSEYIKEQDEK